MLLPAFKGVDTVANLANVAPGFVNPRGFVMVNDYQQSPVKDNIFSVGVNIAMNHQRHPSLNVRYRAQA
jgi:sulfide:quinone oxidoreductase